MHTHKFLTSVLLAAALFTTACDDDDDDGTNPTATNLSATLTTAQEVPDCLAAAAGATGTASVTINAAETSVTLNSATFTGLSGAATMAHIHYGEPDESEDIIFTITDITSPITSQTWTAANYPSPAPAGVPDTFEEFIDEMKEGDSYINIHTAACPNGEIRGQLTVQNNN